MQPGAVLKQGASAQGWAATQKGPSPNLAVGPLCSTGTHILT